MQQGSLTLTQNQYDVAIEGKGYFQILMPSGETAYTRAGNFSVDDQGRLVTEDGYLVQPSVTIPQDAIDVSISKTGQIQVTQQGQTAPTIVGQLQTATFFNEAGLDAIGDNLFLESGASGAPNVSTPGDVGFGTLLQGYTEASNVDAVGEITALIVAQRAYEMNSKVITTADQMLQTASQIARG
jgi:flagellar basal-body rod protein FlgG